MTITELILYMRRNGTNPDDAYRAIQRHLATAPRGWQVLTAYTNGREVVVMDDVGLIDDSEQHNCDDNGCSSFDHVLCRFMFDEPKEPQK